MNSPPADPPYRADLAFIHDEGYGHVARHAAEFLLAELARRKLPRKTIVDLGCGPGLLASAVGRAGYPVYGVDLSPDMLALARVRAPDAEFHLGSFLDVTLPECAAVVSIGECLSYLFDEANTDAALGRLFRRIHAALTPSGLFVFDVVEPGRASAREAVQRFRESPDWTVLVTAQEDRQRQILTREIITFRRVGELWRRDREVHRQRLFARKRLIELLQKAGFSVRLLRGYGAHRFPRGGVGFLARKR
jgi:SAM-dependent methyltransferase